MVPSVEESRAIIHQNALDVAKILLQQRGITFKAANSLKEAKVIFKDQVTNMVLRKHDVEGAAACLMQNHSFLKKADFSYDAQTLSKTLCRMADDYFYDRSETDLSLKLYQLAAGLDPCEQALWETIAPCLQGQPIRPEVALPYAVVAAHMNPERDEVNYVLSKIKS